MREHAPFRADDLDEIDERLLSRATSVIAMQEVAAGNRNPDAIALRHDCDADHSLATAVKMAAWEAERGYRSTYYVLHSSPYWGFPEFRESLETIAICGHEIGIHADGLAQALLTGRDPDIILDEALSTLRGWGFQVRGVAGHGNSICNRDRADGEGTLANDEQFVECARPQEGPPDRVIVRGSISLKLRPRPLADFGLDYEALVSALPLPFRISDSGGKWLNPGWDETCVKFNGWLGTNAPDRRQLHFLQHPDWYREAFPERRAVAA